MSNKLNKKDMGYSTEFKGQLKFTKELVASELAIVKKFFGEDCRDHPDWNCEGYIDLRFTENMDGIEWDDDTDKNHGMVDHVNLIITEMRKHDPEFGLVGEMLAQGEDPRDKWVLKIENGKAVRIEASVKGEWTECPHCGKEFLFNPIPE